MISSPAEHVFVLFTRAWKQKTRRIFVSRSFPIESLPMLLPLGALLHPDPQLVTARSFEPAPQCRDCQTPAWGHQGHHRISVAQSQQSAVIGPPKAEYSAEEESSVDVGPCARISTMQPPDSETDPVPGSLQCTVMGGSCCLVLGTYI